MLHLIKVMIIVVTTLLISIRYFRGNDPMLSCSGYLHDFVLSWSSDLGRARGHTPQASSESDGNSNNSTNKLACWQSDFDKSSTFGFLHHMKVII